MNPSRTKQGIPFPVLLTIEICTPYADCVPDQWKHFGYGRPVPPSGWSGNAGVSACNLFRAGTAWCVALMIVGLSSGCSEKTPTPSLNENQQVADRGTSFQTPLDGQSVTSVVRFEERAAQSGLLFSYANDQQAGHFSIIESLGGGIALFDYDNDGRLDLFAPGGGRYGTGHEIGGRSPALFRCLGDMNYVNNARQAAVDLAPYYSHGALAGDYDNDGFVDLLVTGYGGLLLFHNQSDGTFIESAVPSGLNDPLWSSSAAWIDNDGDGDLDLYVVHYVNWSFENDPFCKGPKPKQREVCPPRRFDPLPDSFFNNNGDGSFNNVSREVGLRTDGKGLGVLSADFDQDGDLDIYVANDTVPNFFYRNDGTGHLEDVSLMSATSLSDQGMPEGSMGVDFGDFDLDGLPDLWVTNYERESFALYRNCGDCVFQHVSQSTGVTAVGGLYVGWGIVFFDCDRDGDEDIFVSNGHVIRYPINAPLLQQPLLFENLSGKRFRNIARQSGPYLATPHMGRGVAVGDVDNDGDLDLVVSHTNEPLALLINESAVEHHWFAVRLTGTKSTRDALGTTVLITTAGGQKQIRQPKSGGSYTSSHAPRLFFGLGAETTVERVEIRWPTGAVQSFENLKADQVLHVIEHLKTPPE